MWMCRQVAKALAEHNYRELPRYRRIGLKIHVALCAMCGKYHRQVMYMQDGVRGFLEEESAGDIAPDVHLSDDAKERIKNRMRES